MIIYLDSKWNVVDKKDATFAKVIPDDGAPPYFIAVDDEDKPATNA
jgi:hypothetical protein